MLITVMSERELHVPAAGAGRRRPRLPARRGDEPVRRRRHGAHLQRHLRPRVPAQRRLPDGGGGGGDRRPGRRRRRPAVGRADRRARPAHARPPRPARRLVGARRARRDGRRDVAGGAPRAAGRRHRRSASTPCSWPCPAGSACARAACARPRRSSPSCGARCSASAVRADGRRRCDGKSPGPDGGLPVLKEGPAGGRRRSTRPAARRCRAASWPGTPTSTRCRRRSASSTRRRSTS